MDLQIVRNKTSVFSMYRAEALVDGKRVTKIPNGETRTISVPSQNSVLKIRTGPYVSKTTSLEGVHDGAVIRIAPKFKMGGLTIVLMGGAAFALSRIFSSSFLLAALVIAAAHDLIFLREKWSVTIMNPDAADRLPTE